jgi:EAL domain-containing protein (putative c-di-GMP-specific phosphodiesterase class I)
MVIAEGVERAEELETVKQLGVPLVQGFFLHRSDLVPNYGLPALRAPR